MCDNPRTKNLIKSLRSYANVLVRRQHSDFKHKTECGMYVQRGEDMTYAQCVPVIATFALMPIQQYSQETWQIHLICNGIPAQPWF
jgi:hypothetical protein